MNFRFAIPLFSGKLAKSFFLGIPSVLLVVLLGTSSGLASDAGLRAAFDGADAPEPSRGIQATSLARSEYEVAIVQYWSVGPLMRAEAVMSGHNIVTLVSGDSYSVYDSLTNRGYRIRRSDKAIAGDAKRKRPFGMHLQEIVDQGGEKIREENLDGAPVDIYRVTDEKGRRTLWVQRGEDQIPIRLESYERSRGRTGRLDWINWLAGVEISKEFFEPPGEVEFEDFGSYEEFRIRMAQGPISPAPPFFPELIDDGSGP